MAKRARIVPAHCMYLLATGWCQEPAGHGVFGNFCEAHATMLAEVREEIQAELSATSRYHRNGEWRPPSRKPPTCCNPYCTNPRLRGAAFCDPCLEAGMVEEVA